MTDLRELERREDRAAVRHLTTRGVGVAVLGVLFLVMGVAGGLAGPRPDLPPLVPVGVAVAGVLLVALGVRSVRQGLALRRGRRALDAAQESFDRMPSQVRARARAEGWSPDPVDRSARPGGSGDPDA